MRPPQWLYDARHPLLNAKWEGRQRWYHRALLRLIGWTLSRFELWENRHALRRMKAQAEELEALATRIDKQAADIKAGGAK